MKTDLNFKTYQPDSFLAKYIQCYWIIDNSFCKNKTLTQKIISDGSNGVIFNLASPIDISVGEKKVKNLSDIFIAGATLKPTYLKLQGKIKLIGIRFNIGGSYPFFQNSLNGYIDSVARFDDMDYSMVLSKLRGENQDYKMVEILDKLLLKTILKEKIDLSNTVLDVIRLMIVHDTNITKEKLSSHFDISIRHLERKFKETVGLPIKQIFKVIRIHKSRELIRKKHFATLTQIGYECEYFDQAHFIKEFKKLTDTTPKSYHKQKTKMS